MGVPHQLATWIGLGVMAVLFAVAALLGGRFERWAVLACLGDTALSMTVQQASATWAPAGAFLVIDAACMAILVGLAWRARSPWLAAAAAMEAVIVALDALKLAQAHLDIYAFLAAANLATYGQALLLATAGWAHWRRRRRMGLPSQA